MNDLLVDYLLVAVLPVMGTAFSREYLSWSSLKNDPFLKRLGFLRMWPIPLSVIVWSRLIYSLISYAAGTLALFAAMTFVGWNGYVTQWVFRSTVFFSCSGSVTDWPFPASSLVWSSGSASRRTR